MIIYLVRHGETPWNEKGLLQGHVDIPLSDRGREQAEALREELAHLSFSAAFSSDLSRAKETAQIVLGDKELSIHETELLRETDMGPFEGKSVHEMDLFHRNLNTALKHLSKEEFLSHKKAEGLETYAEVYSRFLKFVERHAVHHDGETLLVATHGGFIRSILEHHDFSHDQTWKVSNCGFIKLKKGPEGLEIEEMRRVTKMVEKTW